MIQETEVKTENWNRSSRAMIPQIKKLNWTNIVCAEIGIYWGIHAKATLELLDIKKFYLIDPYKVYEGYRHNSARGITKAKNRADKALQGFEEKICWINEKSEDASLYIKEKLDFVYIDGNHSYDYVLKDLELYYPLVKEGGYIGGDDWHINYQTEDCEAPKAIRQFCKMMKIEEIFIGLPKSGCPDWWLIKK